LRQQSSAGEDVAAKQRGGISPPTRSTFLVIDADGTDGTDGYQSG
jgi:hypothetical protein